MIWISLILLLNFPTSNVELPGWQNLFNGRDLSGWIQTGGEAIFDVVNNTIVGKTVMNTPNSFLCTEDTYRDFILEFEFRIDPSLNSGVQIRSLSMPDYQNGRVHGYQVEIDPSPRGWTCGIYDEARTGWLYPVSEPDQELARNSFKNNRWNDVRVEAIGNQIKTWLNGIPVANLFDDQTAEGFIALQVNAILDSSLEGTQVIWRNIRINITNPEKFTTSTTAPEISNLTNKLTQNEIATGWKLLFDGKTSNGWRGACLTGFPDTEWKVDNGMLTALPELGEELGGIGILTFDKFMDFCLQLQVKLAPHTNSGIKYFVKEYEEYIDDRGRCALGPEFQIIDNDYPQAELTEYQKMGALYNLIEPQNVNSNPIGQWNNIRIVSRGNKIEHWINGFKVVEYDRESPDFDMLVGNVFWKDFNGFGKSDGYILLQDHGNEVSFRSIKIRTF